MSTSEIRMYDALKTTLGENEAKAFIDAHNESVVTKFMIMKNDLATKGDLLEVKNELQGEIKGLRKELYDFKLEMKDEFGKVRVEFTRNLYRASLIQTITIIGTVLAIIFLRT